MSKPHLGVRSETEVKCLLGDCTSLRGHTISLILDDNA